MCVCVKHKGKFRPDSPILRILCTFAALPLIQQPHYFTSLAVGKKLLPRLGDLFGYTPTSRMNSRSRDSLSENGGYTTTCFQRGAF